MSRINIAPVVEGHGDHATVPILIRRVWSEIVGGAFAHVLPPVRMPKSRLMKPEELNRAVDIASTKLAYIESADPKVVLVVFDADEDLPCVVAPRLLQTLRGARSHIEVSIVIANREYETWFACAAESLMTFFRPESIVEPPADAEGRLGKGWVERHAHQYSETIEQPRMTAVMDLALCRSRSASFDKFCRGLEARAKP